MSNPRRSFRAAAAIGPLITVAAVGCLELRDEGPAPVPNPCTRCHGSSDRAGSQLAQAAPPSDLAGNVDSSSPGVGAHQIHLNASSTHAAVECDECHVVPKSASTPGHADSDRPAELTFGSIATRKNHSPRYDPDAHTCTDTYCHRSAAPQWTAPRDSTKACGTCHTLPPPAPHPRSSVCWRCHGEVVDSQRAFVAPEKHVNGKVDVVGQTCHGCHGTAESFAPPPDLAGNVDRDYVTVGAHQAHLAGGKFSRKVTCTTCHMVPDKVDAVGHIDETPGAELSFAEVAVTGNATPSWDRDARICSGTWCHGPSAPEQSKSPKWTSVGGPLPCTGCHGAPPASPHPQSVQCSRCHPAVVGADNKTIIDRSLHVNGVVDVASKCNACHGSPMSNAPPVDLTGSTDSSSVGVGAHQAHLMGGSSSRPVECRTCHVVPTEVGATGHIDGTPGPELSFSGVALAGDASPSWDPATRTCTGAWCHGPSSPTESESPDWTTAAGPLQCDGCHTTPPPPPHIQLPQCSRCHTAVVGPDDRTIIDRSLHVNGMVDVSVPTACDTCHGSASSPSPPPDLAGNTDTSERGVGAHQRHIEGGSIWRAVQCGECHLVPSSPLDPGHFDTALPAELTFSGVAVTWGAQPSFDGVRCTNTYCHGGDWGADRKSGGATTAPVWTKVDGSQIVCGSCHGLPPPPAPLGKHPDTTLPCNTCHSNVDATFNIVDPNLHANGQVDF